MHLLRNLIHPMQNQDPTLYEKSWGVFRLGRHAAATIMIVGTAVTFLLSYWFSNIIQALIVSIFSGQFGFFSGHGLKYTLHFWSITLLNPHAFFTNEDLVGLLSIFSGWTWIPKVIHWISFAFLWYTVVFVPFMYVFTKSRNLNHHEYGSSRLATPKEVRWETFKIPDRYYNYGRHAGFPVMHTFNWRGKLNDAVKMRKGKMQSTLGINDIVVSYLYKDFVIAISFVLCALLLWCAISAYQYFTEPLGLVSWYSRVPHAFVIIAEWLVLSAWRLVKMVFSMQGFALSQPVYIFGLFYAVEVLLIAMASFHVKDLFKFYNNGPIYALLHDNARQKMSNWHQHVLKKQAELSRYAQKYGTSTHESWVSALKDTNKRLHKHNGRLKNVYSYRNDKKPSVEAFDCFSHHPKLTIEFAYLEAASILIPLDDGITGWYYISPRPHNVWIYGTSGSGKGQMIVNPQMDINSRADPQDKPNMIVTDPKGESAAGAYRMLKQRGYDVKVMNIMDMSHSMSFNPLRLVIRYARLGDISKAENACSQLSYTIYDPSGQGQNSYFYTSAASLFDAMTFALIALAHARFYGMNDLVTYKTIKGTHKVHDDGDGEGGVLTDSNGDHVKKGADGHYHSDVNAFGKVTIHNISEMVAQLGGATGIKKGDTTGTTVKRLMFYFDHLAEELSHLRTKEHDNRAGFTPVERDQLAILDQANQKYQQSKLAGSHAAGSIYSTFLDRLRIYMSEDVAKMTSKDNFDPAAMGFDRLLTIQFDRKFKLQNIVTQSWHAVQRNDGQWVRDTSPEGLIETNKSHLSGIGMADVPFANPIPGEVFFVTVDVHDEIVRKVFHFEFRCQKNYYTPKIFKVILNDYKRAPMIADMNIVQADAKRPFDKDGHYNKPLNPKLTKPEVVDRYTGKRVLRNVSVDMVDYPGPDEYASCSPTSGLQQFAQKPKSVFIKRQEHFLYNPRPTAWFIVAPQNKQELNQLGTFAIGQTFNVLSSISMSYTNGRHVQRPLQMILDELGNLPAIRHLDRMASFGRSQHIYIMPIFQAREQADQIYKQDVTNIVYDNCPTTVYILSNSSKTIQDVSQGFGNRTVTNTSRSHDPARIKSTNYNENEMKQPVMMPDTLRHLQLGEAAILRTTDRENLWGRSVKPYGIFDTNGTKNGKKVGPSHILPYSWTFLGKTFSKGSLSGVPIVTPHKYLDLESLTIQFNDIYLKMEMKHNIDGSLFDTLQQELAAKIGRIPGVSDDKKTNTKSFKLMYEAELSNAVAENKQNSEKALQDMVSLRKSLKYVPSMLHMHTAVAVAEWQLAIMRQHTNFDILNQADYAYPYHFDGIWSDLTTIQTFKPQYLIRLLRQSNDQNESLNALLNRCSGGLTVNMNQYLMDIGMMDKQNNLTLAAKRLIDNPNRIHKILSSLTIAYQPKVSLSKFMAQIFDGLKVPESFKGYRGLLFLSRICNKKQLQEFMTGQGNRKFAIQADIYVYSVLSIFDIIATTGSHVQRATNKLKHTPLVVSKAYAKLSKDLNSLNKGSVSASTKK